MIAVAAGVVIIAAAIATMKSPRMTSAPRRSTSKPLSHETARIMLRRALPANEFVVDVLQATSHGESVKIVAKLSTFDVVMLQSVEIDEKLNLISRIDVTPYNGNYVPVKNMYN